MENTRIDTSDAKMTVFRDSVDTVCWVLWFWFSSQWQFLGYHKPKRHPIEYDCEQDGA